MTTITTICKRCGRTRVTKCVDTFYSTANMWSSACGFFHGITRHWGTLSPKAHRWAPFYCVVVPLHLILALVWDLLRATLLVVTSTPCAASTSIAASRRWRRSFNFCSLGLRAFIARW